MRKVIVLIAVLLFGWNLHPQFGVVPTLKIRIFYEEGFNKKVKSITLVGLEGEGEVQVYEVNPEGEGQSWIIGIKEGKYLVNVEFEGEEGGLKFSYAHWDSVDGRSEMRLENTVIVTGRGSGYLNLYIAKGRGFGGAFKLKEGRETEILWLLWPQQSMVKSGKGRKFSSKTSSGEEVCSFWDGSCRISLNVEVENDIDCSYSRYIIMDSPDQVYCFKDGVCKKISDAHGGKGLGLTRFYISSTRSYNYGYFCKKKEKCENAKKCQCKSDLSILAIIKVTVDTLVLSEEAYCMALNIVPFTDECECVYDSMFEHEHYHCIYGKKLVIEEMEKLREKLKEAVKKFCEKEKKAPLCESPLDCRKRFDFSLFPKIGTYWKEYMGDDLDEEGAIKVECDYQRKYNCVQPKCKVGSEQ